MIGVIWVRKVESREQSWLGVVPISPDHLARSEWVETRLTDSADRSHPARRGNCDEVDVTVPVIGGNQYRWGIAVTAEVEDKSVVRHLA